MRYWSYLIDYVTDPCCFRCKQQQNKMKNQIIRYKHLMGKYHGYPMNWIEELYALDTTPVVQTIFIHWGQNKKPKQTKKT